MHTTENILALTSVLLRTKRSPALPGGDQCRLNSSKKDLRPAQADNLQFSELTSVHIYPALPEGDQCRLNASEKNLRPAQADNLKSSTQVVYP